MVVVVSNIVFVVLNHINMKKKDIYALIVLMVLTLTTSLFATNFSSLKYVVVIILILSIAKFLIIAFQFMELKKANIFWKIFLIGYLSIFLLIISISSYS